MFLALNNGSCQLVHIPTKTPLPPLRILERKIGQINDCDTSRIEPATFSTCWIEENAGLCSLFLLSIDGLVSAHLRVRKTIERIGCKNLGRAIPAGIPDQNHCFYLNYR